MDQDLRDLTIQIQDLIRTLRSTSGSGATNMREPKDTGTEVVRSVDKMVVALAKLAVTLDGSKKTKTAEEEAIKKFTKSVDKTTEVMDKEEAERKKSTRTIAEEVVARAKEAEARKKLEAEERDSKIKDATTRTSQAARELNSRIQGNGLLNASLSRNRGEIAEFGKALIETGATSSALKGAFGEMTGASTPAQIGLQFLSAGLKGATTSLKGFSTSLLDGQRGPQVTAKAFTDLVKPIADLTSSFGTAAMAIGGIAMLIPGFQGIGIAALAAGAGLKAVAVAGETLAEYNERAAKQLASTFDVYNKLSQASITVEDGINGTTSLIHTLNMTTAEAEKFSELLGSSSKNLAIMGGTAGEGAKRFAAVAGELNKSQLGQTFEVMGITADEQREATLQYMSIQARTGQLQLKNTQQLVQESGKFVEELDLAAKLTGSTRKAQQEAQEANMAESRYRSALYAAERRGDKAEVEKLKKLGDMAAMLRTMGLNELATGTIQFGASGGAPTTPQAINAMMQLGLQNVLNDPNITAVGALQKSLNYSKEMLDRYAETTKVTGDLGPLLKDIPETIDASARLAKAEQEATRLGFKSLDDYLKSEQGKAALGDPKLKAVVEGNRAQLAAAQIMETGINEFNTAAKIHDDASKVFAKAVEKFGKKVGLNVAGGIGTFESGGAVAAAGGTTATAGTGASGGSAAVGGGSGSSELDFGGALETAPTPAKPPTVAKPTELPVGPGANLGPQTSMGGMGPYAPTTPEQAPQLSAIRDLIASGESNGNYNVMVGGQNYPLTDMTIKQVMELQRKLVRENKGSAAGKYQIIYTTLAGLVGKMGVKMTDKFDASLQDRMAEFLIKQRGFDQYSKNPTPEGKKRFLTNLAKEWASLPAGPNDQSYYAGVGNNKAHISWNEALSKFGDGGIVHTPTKSLIGEKGPEAVIPLKNGSVPVMMPAIDQMVSATTAVTQQMQTLKDELAGMMREIATALSNNNTAGAQERMIQILENIARSQNQTATASKRLASVAIN